MTAFACEHTFKTSITATKFEAMVAKACRDIYLVELIGHDPGVIPAVRLFTVAFTTPEDRDRMRIAMRFVEKEQGAVRAPAPSPMVAGQLASA